MNSRCSTSARVLADILVMTEDMLEQARNNHWEEVTRLEEQRREALNVCFSSDIPVDQANIFSEALAAMLHMNEELIALLENAKAEVAIKRTDQARTSKSLGHYLDIESTH
ncbi:flagellar protein FliT [Luminiphilus sp.]|nr:flagellar protein FliT [Luminiphilus sp.]MDC3251030.1 flagellar protein FliT [Luminiphilus sp.]